MRVPRTDHSHLAYQLTYVLSCSLHPIVLSSGHNMPLPYHRITFFRDSRVYPHSGCYDDATQYRPDRAQSEHSSSPPQSVSKDHGKPKNETNSMYDRCDVKVPSASFHGRSRSRQVPLMEIDLAAGKMRRAWSQAQVNETKRGQEAWRGTGRDGAVREVRVVVVDM